MGSPAGAALKSVHILRKPCSESTVAANVLRWGTGALSINECRIGNGGGTSRMGQAAYPKNADGSEDRSKSWARTGHGILTLNAGRWPANLALQHLDGCAQDGTRTVKGAGHYPSARSAGSQISGPSGHTGQANLTERHLKEETVTAWACVQGCPVASLDAQSGELTSGSWNGHRNKAKTKPGIYAPFVLRDEVGTQGNKGGASRFFKQVKP